MEKYLKRNIKEVLAEFPAIGPLLETYGIQCVTCAAGNCALGEILEVHRLSADDEIKLMNGIGAILSPGEVFRIPARPANRGALPGTKQFSPPLKLLVDEHKVIKRLLALMPAILDSPIAGTAAWFTILAEAIDFIKNYADRFHHAKEEEILFKYFDEKREMIVAMCADHETGRAHVRAAKEAIARKDVAEAGMHLKAYRELLIDHIRKEDEILYPWMDGRMSDSQVGHLYGASIEIRNRPETKAADYESWIDALEQKFAHPAKLQSTEQEPALQESK
jgi:hemerythrin-like domain-containing protein